MPAFPFQETRIKGAVGAHQALTAATIMHPISVFSCVSVFAALISAHVEMSNPPPRGSKHNSGYTPTDYNLNAPLSSFNMCGGKAKGPVVATYNAGEQVPVRFEGPARHGGGICQFSLSYDNGQNFVVIQNIDGGCPDESYEWPVKIPANAPSCDSCIFAWTWINAIGNREFYMNCADIAIHGGPGNSISGAGLLLANIGGHQVLQPPATSGGGPSGTGTTIKHLPINTA